MKTIKNYSLLFLVLSFSIGKAQEPPSSEDYNYNTFEAQKKWIVGTYISDDDSNWKIQFTKDGKCINSYIGDSTDEYTYTLEYSTQKANTPSGHINIYTLYLKAIPSDPNEDLTYEMYIDDTGLALYPWGHGGQFVFSRVKSKESTSSETVSKEEEKESEVSPRRELKSSDYNRGYLDGGLAYEQCKNQQFKESSDILDSHRSPPMKRMGDDKAFPLGMDDCREEAFERIKLRSNEYRRGFEEGWRDASMPLNKEKKHKTKIK